MMTPTKKTWLASLGALALLGCMPDVPPPEADPPEVEVSGGELPEYEYDAADLEESGTRLDPPIPFALSAQPQAAQSKGLGRAAFDSALRAGSGRTG